MRTVCLQKGRFVVWIFWDIFLWFVCVRLASAENSCKVQAPISCPTLGTLDRMEENGTIKMETNHTDEAPRNGTKRPRSESPVGEIERSLAVPKSSGHHRYGVSLKTLDIQGFRSFGEEAGSVGHIDFMSPVTLIIGPNGTGKTTIIECLKFATTGETPPNSKGGAHFIRDPKLCKKDEVRAQVNLKFIGADGKEYLLSRTAQATLAKNARGQHDIRYKTLENSLCYYEAGKKISITHTVDQAGQTMQAILGVVKPILNSVIFCHQEESDWPLDMGSKLKEKFDEIFSATRYIKALEALRELKKNDKAELKAAEVTRDTKRTFRNEAETKQLELEACKTDAATVATSVEELQKNFAELKASHDSLQARVEKVTKLEKENDKLTTKVNTLTNAIADLEKRLGDEYAGTTEELDREMGESKNTEQEKKLLLTTEKKKLTELDKRLTELRKNLAKQSQTLGALKTETDLNAKTVTERDAKVTELATTYQMQSYVEMTEFQPEIIETFGNDFAKLVTDEEDKLELQKKDITNELDELTKRVIEKKQEQDALVRTIARLKKDIREKTVRDEDITEQLKDMDTQSQRLDALEAKIASQTTLLAETEATVDLTELKARITDESQTRTNLADRLKPLKTVVTQKEKQQGLHTSIEVIQNQLNEKKETVERQRNKLQAFVDKVGPQLTNEEIKATFDTKLREATRQCDSTKKAIGRLETDVAVRERERNAAKQDMDTNYSKLKEFEDELERIGGVEKDLEAALRNVDDEMKRWQGELAEWQGKSDVIKSLKASLLRQRQDGRSCCPTCHRGFNDDSAATELAEEFDNTLRDVPNQIALRQSKIADCQSRRDKIVAFQPETKKNEKTKKLANDLDEKQKKLATDIASLQKQKSDHEATLEEAMTLHQTCTASQPDVLKLDSALTDLKKSERELNNLNGQLDKSGDTRTLEEVKAEKESVEAELERVTKSLDESRDVVSEQEGIINKQKEELNSLREQKVKITEKLQEKVSLEHQQEELKKEVEAANTELEESNAKEAPLKEVIAELSAHKTQTRQRLNAELNDKEKAMTTLKDGQKDLQRLNQKLKEFERKGIAEKLQTAETEVNSVQEDIKNKEQERTERAEDLRKIENDLLGVKTRDQTLKDNRTLRDKREELKTVQATVSGIEEQLKVEEPATLRTEFKDIVSKKNVCNEQLHTQQGRRTELEKNIRSKEKELEYDHYKNAKKLYNDAVVKCQIIDQAMKDVEKFYKALDYGVMKFHSNKMEEINRLMRDLWQNTYQGNDIDYIEIRSDADESGIEGDKIRRQYNYRVVMVTGDTALDMRGRCSAGQRVLACLIIRLALAEAFAASCGVLALDEPTTNLDRDNIIYLAKSLANLIRGRSTGQHHRLQLIIITHDAEFLNALNVADTGILVDRYYTIHKEPDGTSKLKNLPYAGHF